MCSHSWQNCVEKDTDLYASFLKIILEKCIYPWTGRIFRTGFDSLFMFRSFKDDPLNNRMCLMAQSVSGRTSQCFPLSCASKRSIRLKWSICMSLLCYFVGYGSVPTAVSHHLCMEIPIHELSMRSTKIACLLVSEGEFCVLGIIDSSRLSCFISF